MWAIIGKWPATLGSILLACATGVAHAGAFRAGAGIDYTSGDYGAAQTINQTYIPVSAAYREDRWGMRLTVPYVIVEGPGTAIDADGEFIAGPDESRGGLGDIILSATLYDIVRNDETRFYVDLGAKVKLGTANEAEGLGTGEHDYSVQTDLLKNFDRFALFATAGYKLRGDPEGIDLRDVAFGMIGGDYRLGAGVRTGLIYDYRPSAIRGVDPLSEAAVYVSFAKGRGLSFQPYLVAGFSNSSPDWGAGLSVGWRARA